MKSVMLIRKEFELKQTLGGLAVYDDNEEVFSCKTLELPWKNNQKRISCIPEGSYEVVKRNSKKYGDHLHVTNVKGRSFILIHSGNYYTDIRGCILVGNGYKDINRDGVRDIINSKVTLKALLQVVPSSFQLMVQKQSVPEAEELVA